MFFVTDDILSATNVPKARKLLTEKLLNESADEQFANSPENQVEENIEENHNVDDILLSENKLLKEQIEALKESEANLRLQVEALTMKLKGQRNVVRIV